jgi:hypothetical protein
MSTFRKNLEVPPAFALDYEALLSHSSVETVADRSLFLRKDLPSKWSELYTSAVARPTNIIRFQDRTFEYLYDLYSGIEAMGEVPYDQTVEDRIVAVFGTSADPGESHTGRHSRSWLGEQNQLPGANRDKGHFIARCIGGGFNLNVFSQDRHLNRGWSSQGKTYREMERYCQGHPGTFCFSRPIYADGSSVPRWVEFGIVQDDESLWVEVFDNLPQF